MITLCLDFGNTRLKAAIFKGADLISEIILQDEYASIETLLDNYKPGRSILSSVIDHKVEVESLLAARTAFHKLTSETKLNFTVAVAKPQAVGSDRLALIAAAAHFHPLKNTLVIALGSCITYNFVNQYGQFLGGSISPGMEMRFRAMHDYTAKLPLVKENWIYPLVGYDTKTNLQSGVIIGIISEIEGFIEKYNEKFDNFNVVLTGGNSAYFASQLKKKIFADHNFLFKGLYALSELNNCGN